MLGDVENLESRWDFEYCRCIKAEEIKGVMRKTSSGREIEPNETLVKF